MIVVPPFPVPKMGEGEIQDEFPVTDQVRVPPPRFVMDRGCAAGLPVPCWTVKDRLVGLTPMAGGTGAGVTVKETGMVTGVAVDPAGQIVTWPLWVPVVMEPVVTLIVTVPVPAPVPGVCDSQVAS